MTGASIHFNNKVRQNGDGRAGKFQIGVTHRSNTTPQVADELLKVGQ